MTRFHLSLLAAALSCAACAAPPPISPLSYAAGEALGIGLPYLREYRGGDKAVYVYGSYHTNDPADIELTDIERRIARFKPDLILYEGDHVALAPTRAESAQYFEMGFVRWLATEKRIPALNLEPPSTAHYASLLAQFPKSHVLLALILAQNTLYIKQHTKAEFAAYYPALVRDLEAEGLPLTGAERTMSYFETQYRDYFGKPFEPATFDPNSVQPKYSLTGLNRINQASAAFRDRHMLGLIEASLAEKRRVFVLVGGWHATVWQPVLEDMLRRQGAAAAP